MSASEPAEPRVGPALGLGLGAASATLGALPAAIRIASDPGSWLASWLLLSGALAVPMGPLAWAALRLRAAPEGERRAFRIRVLGIATCVGPLAVVGAVLQAGTHHRPLGGATFAALAMVAVVACMLFVGRLDAWAQGDDVRFAKLARILLTLTAGIGLLVAAGLLFMLGSRSEAFRSGVFDGLNAAGFWALAVLGPLPAAVRKAAARFGLPVWAGLVVLAVGLCQWAPLATAADRGAPVPFAPLVWCSTGLGDG